MKNALKCVFELLDLVKNWKNGTTFSEKGEYRKPEPSVSWDTSSVPVVIARIRNHWFIANVPVGTLN